MKFYIHFSCFNGGEIHQGPFDSAELADAHLEAWPGGWQWDAVIDSHSPVGTCFPVSAPHADIIREIEGDYLTSGDCSSLVAEEHACHLATTFAYLIAKPSLTDQEYDLVSRLGVILNAEEERE